MYYTQRRRFSIFFTVMNSYHLNLQQKQLNIFQNNSITILCYKKSIVENVNGKYKN